MSTRQEIILSFKGLLRIKGVFLVAVAESVIVLIFFKFNVKIEKINLRFNVKTAKWNTIKIVVVTVVLVDALIRQR